MFCYPFISPYHPFVAFNMWHCYKGLLTSEWYKFWKTLHWFLNKGVRCLFFVFCISQSKKFLPELGFCQPKNLILLNSTTRAKLEHMGLDARKPVFEGLRKTKALTSLRIRTDWSATPLLFAYWKVSYLNLLQAKFQVLSRRGPYHS